MEVIKLKPEEVKVKEGLERYRKEYKNIKELSESIKRVGQIQPIVITREKELISGGRRLAACTLSGTEILCVFKDSLSNLDIRMMELEENLYREAFSPAEKCIAIKDIHGIKQEQYGKSGSGKVGGWTLDDTAKLLGVSRASIIDDIKNANMLEKFPELMKVKKKGDIKKAARGLEKLASAIAGMKNLKDSKKEDLVQFYFADAIEFMPTLEDNSINILLTDPLYGIQHDKLAIKESIRGFKFDDARDKGLDFYLFLALESFRFTVENAHGYVFLAPEHFTAVRNMFLSAGWQACIKPLIWVKPNVGQCNLPTHWPASSYEMILYIRKDKSKIVKEGQPDFIIEKALVGNYKDHDYEKPVPLLLNLLDRVSIPGGTLFDPCAGTCSSLIAGRIKKLKVIGCDNSKEAFAIGSKKLNDFEGIKKEK